MRGFFQHLCPLVGVFVGRRGFSNWTQDSKATIFSLSTAKGVAGVAVIRVSGPEAMVTFERMTNLGLRRRSFEPRKLCFTSFRHPTSRELLDRGLFVWFKGPHSYTGEDCCEFHVHGGVAVVGSLLQALSTLPRFRIAEPGEFTRRGFHNGKLDLTSAEAVADLIRAETDLQRQLALRHTQGQLRLLCDSWRQHILQNVAHVEAFIDFSEEENIESDILSEVRKELRGLVAAMDAELGRSKSGERLRSGVRAVLAGKPNVGKSSLLNLLCGRAAAIVAPTPGTTRDAIDTHLDLDGVPVQLTDTAGLRNAADLVEHQGVLIAKQKLEDADLILFLMDDVKDFADWEFHPLLQNYQQNVLLVINKTDLMDSTTRLELELKASELAVQSVSVSCADQTGIPELLEKITARVSELCNESLVDQGPVFTQTRHRLLVEESLRSLRAGLELLDSAPDLAAQKFRYALAAIGKITGVVSADDVLDVVFRDFCIGK